MAWFTKKKATLSKGTVFATLLIIAVVLLILPQKLTKGLNFLFIKVYSSVSPGKDKTVDSPRIKNLSEDSVARSEYDRLKKEYMNLYAELLTVNERYEKLAKFRSGLPKLGAGLVMSEVIDSSIGGFRHELLIDKGEVDGIKTGQYVLAEQSIVGIVNETDQATARVRLVTDSNNRITVRIWRVGSRKQIEAQMIGDGKTSGKVDLVSKEHDIRKDDWVYVAPLPGKLESPCVIGSVSQVKTNDNNPLLWDITVTPVQNLKEIVTVAVIVDSSGK